MDAKELRNMTVVELATKSTELQSHIREAKFAGATQGGSKASAARALRRDLARVLTIIGEKSS